MLDAFLRIRRFTQVSEKLLNLISTDIGRPVSDLKPRINAPQLEEMVRQVVDTLSPDEREVQDHRGALVLSSMRPYRTTENRIEGAVLQLIDIDQLKKTLEQVKNARDYAAAIVETVRAPLIVLDPELRIETANRAYFETFRSSPEETLQRSVYEVGGGQFDIPRLREVLSQLGQTDSAIGDVEVERDFERVGHKVFAVNARRINRSGQAKLTLLAFEDVTDRKLAAEARYRRLFEAAKDGMLIADAATGEITDANPHFETLFGYRREELIGKRIWDAAAFRDAPDLKSKVQEARGEEATRFPDLMLRARDGRSVQVEVVANAYGEGDRQVVQFNVRDITERKRFELQIQHTQKLESLGVLAGGIAHDFNNLLTGIMGNASLGLAELHPPAPIRRYLQEILSASQDAAHLTRQMLAYAGKGAFVVEPVDLSQMIREIEPLIRTSIPKSVAVQMELEDDISEIRADRGQIQQLVMNLMINGAEAVGAGKPGTVLVRTDTRDLDAAAIQAEYPNERLSPGEYVGLEVRDNGSGMDEATKKNIFDPFFTTKFQGRGLGLAAVSGIVRAHGGAIRVYSSPGRGTSFQVLLPAIAAKKADHASAPPTFAPPAGGTILFVDDEKTVRRLADSALTHRGWKVLLAEDGAEAVRLFQEHLETITLVILDLSMPVMDGEAALAQIREVSANVPVIMSTGYGASEAERVFAGRKMAGFLQKPYTVDQMLEVIAAVVGG